MLRNADNPLAEAMELIQEVKKTSIRLAAKSIYPKFFHLVDELLIILDHKGVIIDVSSSWKKLGWDVEDMNGKLFIDFVHPDDRGNTNSAFMGFNLDSASDGLKDRYFNRYLTKGGGSVWLAWMPNEVSTFKDRGFVTGVGSIVKDDRIIAILEERAKKTGDFNRDNV